MTVAAAKLAAEVHSTHDRRCNFNVLVMFAPPICRRSRRTHRERAFSDTVVRRSRRRRRLPSENRSERSEQLDTATLASEAI
jgi:hypothetical protein